MYLWIVIVGGFASFYNSWGIGANDCANSFATSVGSKVLTLKQALVVAAIFEFLGAFLAGSHVTSAIRKKIVNFEIFEDNPGALMLGMVCSNFAAAIWLHIASYLKLPVSTTHSIVGAIIGFSLAYNGSDSVKWDIDGGVGGIILSWIISPLLASLFAFIFYISLKFFVFKSKNAVNRTLMLFPGLTLLVFAVNSYFIFYKGAPQLDLDELPDWEVHTIAWCVAICMSALTIVFYVPYARKKIYGKPYEGYICYKIGRVFRVIGCKLDYIVSGIVHIVHMAFYKIGLCSSPKKHNTKYEEECVESENSDRATTTRVTIDENDENDENNDLVTDRTNSYKEATINIGGELRSSSSTDNELRNRNICEPSITFAPYVVEQPALKPMIDENKNLDENIKALKKQTRDLQIQKKNEKISRLHINANDIDEDVEKLFSSLQVITASCSSFAHGANDVANSIAPLATAVAIYHTGEVNKKNEVPLWLLFMGGIGIVFGLGTWGYKIIDRIGRELTKISPSRGSVIELSAALTVLIASRAEMPVSTTHCQIGAVFGCGVGDGKNNLEWKLFRDIILSWLVTLPAAGLISAALFSFAIYSPSN